MPYGGGIFYAGCGVSYHIKIIEQSKLTILSNPLKAVHKKGPVLPPSEPTILSNLSTSVSHRHSVLPPSELTILSNL